MELKNEITKFNLRENGEVDEIYIFRSIPVHFPAAY